MKKVYVLIESELDGSDPVVFGTYDSEEKAEKVKKEQEQLSRAFLYRIKPQDLL